MSRVPDDRISAITERVSTLDMLSERGHQPVRVSGGVAYFHCRLPDHEDRHPSFTVGPDGRWRCWSQCATGGDVIDLVMRLEKGISKADAIELLARRIGLERPPNRATQGDGPRGGRALPVAEAERLLTHFCVMRRWDPEVLCDLGAFVVSIRGEARVRFPFRKAGQTVFYQDRKLGGDRPKWLSDSGSIPCPFEADRIVRAHKVGAVWVLEGVSDVVALLHHWPDAAVVGCPGSGVLKAQWARAFEGLCVYCIGDNDQAGEKFRHRVDTVLGPLATAIKHLYVPDEFLDVDEWRQADPERFPDGFLAEVDRQFATTEVAA